MCTKPGRCVEGTVMKYCNDADHSRETLHQRVESVAGRRKKLGFFFFFHFKSTMNRKQSRVQYVTDAAHLSELCPVDVCGHRH